MSTIYSPTSACGPSSIGLTAQGVLGVVNDAVQMPCIGCGCVGFQLAGTFVGTVTFEASVDGSNWIAINGDVVPAGTAATSATAPGIYQLPCAGFTQVRARLSAYTSGTLTVTGCTSLAPRST